jgi:hypothetical protein
LVQWLHPIYFLRTWRTAPRSGWPQWSRTATSLTTEPTGEEVQWLASNLARNAWLRPLLGNGGVEAHDQSRALPDLDNIAAVEKLLGRFDGRRILAMLNEASSFDARFCRASQ